MQNEYLIHSAETIVAARRILSKLTVSCGPQRRMNIRFGLRRRASCLTKRSMIAALRQAELADWQASGGDYLNSMHQQIQS